MKIIYAFIGIALFSIQSCTDPYANQKLSYGSFLKQGGIEFKIHAPSSDQVQLIIFDNPEDENGVAYEMASDGSGDWTIFINNLGVGTIYGYRLSGPVNEDSVIIADPYSKAAITQNTWRHVAKTLVIDESFDWQGDTWKNFDQKDLIIYEAHLRDMTRHPSSGVSSPGTYNGFIEENQNGGISHLKRLGINAVQFLPLWDYANVEIPYKKRVDEMFNDWNPYERNHWGYMPTFFMAPESYYASDGTRKIGEWNGGSGKAVQELKEMVRELHRNDIAVILDVVINHVSNYDWHPLKFIDRDLYFQLDENGDYISQCCGNLLDTENEHVRQYLIESLKYWMLEYHIDGFRFDQAHILSLETAELISDELRSINPAVIIYGEAWDNRSGEFSEIEWGSFNAHFRDVIRGDLHDYDKKGFLFGSYRPNENKKDLKSIIGGTTKIGGGVYKKSHHAINFLEVHDDYCFSDFLRLSSGENKKNDIITNKLDHLFLSSKLTNMNKLAALILFTSQGIPLIHQGQEWGHSKIIAQTNVPDFNVNTMDPNPYNKDNETNWVNWDELKQNQDLVDFYGTLIELRKQYTHFRRTDFEDIIFYDLNNTVGLGYGFNGEIVIFINGDNKNSIEASLPNGSWNLLINTASPVNKNYNKFKETITIEPISGVLLTRE
jgi:pullulanase/glycogen debranching enzyme|tara:strand:- start:2968 stop:4956 length:1989 start_codon:yes stop_codon:yes gene_type:complete